MKRTIALLLVMVLVLTGCVEGRKAEILKDGDTVGTGSRSFPLTIVNAEEKEITITVSTDEKTVGDALLKLHIISGSQGEYGLYILTVNGETMDYDKDGAYWAFYADGVYAEQSASQTEIQDGIRYMLKVETA